MPGAATCYGPIESLTPLVLVVDGARGLRIDLVSARTPGGREIPIEVAGTVKSPQVLPLRGRLVSGVVERVPRASEE